MLRRLLAATDVAAAALAGTLGAIASELSAVDAAIMIAGTAVVWPLVLFGGGLYATDDPPSWTSGVAEAKRVVFCAVLSSWILWGLGALLDAKHAELGALLTVAVVAFLSLSGRGFTRALAYRAEELRQRTLILGSGVVAGELMERLERQDELGLLPVGFVDDDPHALEQIDLPHLGFREDLPRLLEEHDVDRVIVAFSRASHEELLECIRVCWDQGVDIDVVPRLFEFLDNARRIDRIGGIPMLSIDAPRLTRSARATKRALDIGLSLTLLLAVAPLLLLVAIAIKLDSRGPVFFRQLRAGRRGDPFHLIKFRSMRVDAEETKNKLTDENDLADGVMFKIHDDPRITRVGRILRRFSLDELPQLFNVLVGQMSIVGPRPLIFPEADALDAWQTRRLDLRPGITGSWQIYGRSDIPFQDMVRFDYQYVAGWSLARDLEILLATVPAVLSGRGAY